MPGVTFTDAPWARGVVFLVQGTSVYQTLLLNLVRYDAASPMPRVEGDCPAWERDDPLTPERQTPLGYLDYLTWQNRRVHLLPEDSETGPVVRTMTLGPGLRLDPNVRDPQKHYRIDEKRGPISLRFREDRALWRDSAALFSIASDAYRPPVALNWLAELVDDGRTGLLCAAGSATDLASKVRRLRSETETRRRLRLATRAEYEQRYTAAANYRLLRAIYDRALGPAAGSAAARGTSAKAGPGTNAAAGLDRSATAIHHQPLVGGAGEARVMESGEGCST